MMMPSTISLIGKYIILSILSAAGICAENIRSMSTNTDEYTFHFIPEFSSGDWEQAWQACNNSNSSLVVIRNKQEQEELVEYLRKYSITSLIWTAGKTATASNWTWINGKPLGNKRVINEDYHHTVAALNSDFGYKAQAVHHEVYFVCMYNSSGNKCNANRNGLIKLKNGCLNPTINIDSTWSDARNFCLQRDGDLPILDDGDLETLKRRSIFPNTSINTLWLGLNRISWMTSWMWHSNEKNSSDKIEYTDWDDVDQPQPNVVQCVAINATSGRWKAMDCKKHQKFICVKRGLENSWKSTQTASETPSGSASETPSGSASETPSGSASETPSGSTSETPSESADLFTSKFFPYVASGIGVAVVIIFIIITIVAIRSRGNCSKRTGKAESPSGNLQWRPEITDKRVVTTKPLGDSTNGAFTDISGSEYAGNARPGIVYASLDFLNAPHNSNSNTAPTTSTIPLGDVYAEVVATNSNSGQGWPSYKEQLHSMGPIYSNL